MKGKQTKGKERRGKEEKTDQHTTPRRTRHSRQQSLLAHKLGCSFEGHPNAPPSQTHERKLPRTRRDWIWKFPHGTRRLVEGADEETRKIVYESKWKGKQEAMAFLLPKLTTPSCKSLPSSLPKPPQLALPVHSGGKLHGSAPAQAAARATSASCSCSAPRSRKPPPQSPSKSTETKNRTKGGGDPQRSDFYLNLGTAVRTLRDDLPAVFVREPSYDIYR